MRKGTITLDTPMDVVMDDYPETVAVLMANTLHCVGCELASFHCVADAAREHDMNPDRLLAALKGAAQGTPGL